MDLFEYNITPMFVRWSFIFLLFVCFGCNTLQPEHLRTFQDAQSAFDAEDYHQAATLYQQLLDSGVRSGAVYYNIGNAYAKADEPALAVAAYCLAKRYIPTDPHLNANLRTVLTDNGGTLHSTENFIADTLLFWQNKVGYDTKIWYSLVLTVVTFLGGVICLYRPSKRLKRCLAGFAILTAVALVSVGYDWHRFDVIEQVIVTEHAVPRKGNSEQYAPAFVAPIPFGTLAVILDERKDWYFLRFLGGQEGWLPQRQTVKMRL